MTDSIPPDQGAVTLLLKRVAAGDRDALDALFNSLYVELKRLARIQRTRWRGG